MGALYQARWDRLSDLERRYILAVARLGPGPVRVAQVAEALGHTTQQLSTTRATLIDEHRLLTSPRYGQICFALSGFAGWCHGHKPAPR
ncbi:MAG: hypothetical protein ACRDOD_18415, partial [Streptosporangiaceae bacterium]